MAATIALVDDDKNILASVSIAIQAEGYVTRIYSDPQAALDALVETPPDLAVLDVKMPGMDGLELLRRIREKREFPVIFLTSKDDELDEALGLAMGADDYITKPFSQRLLLARIKAILRRVDYMQRAAEAPDDGAAGEPMERGDLAMDDAKRVLAASVVQRAFRRFINVRIYKYYRNLVNFRNRGDPGCAGLPCLAATLAALLLPACTLHGCPAP